MNENEQAKNYPALANVGKRIRALRQQKGMTQAQLAGDDVTRNMLSQIENGSALPSLPTLCALAARLNAPVGALLGDLGDYAGWRFAREMRQLMNSKKYDTVIESCKTEEFEDTHGRLSEILCEAYVCRAEEYYNTGLLTAALQYLEAAERSAEKRISALGHTAKIEDLSTRIFILRTLISSCPAMYPEDVREASDHQTEQLRSIIFDKNDVAIYLYALARLGDLPHGAYSQPHELTESLKSELGSLTGALTNPLYRVHIEAKMDMVGAEYLDAKAKLLPLLSENPPPPLLYDIIADLEFCCKCCGDFENAYKYSGQRLELAKKIN